MNNISLMIPKRRRPVWIAGIDEIDCDPVTLVEIPLLGVITAGEPIERVEEQRRVKVPANMVRKNTYALRVTGHSMIDDNIQDGDIIVIEKREWAENGESGHGADPAAQRGSTGSRCGHRRDPAVRRQHEPVTVRIMEPRQEQT